MKPLLVYITTKDSSEAEQISKRLLEERLVACVNIFKEIRSSFWWEGKIDHMQEVLLIAKTVAGHQEAIANLVSKSHSYQCPCVLFIPVEGGHEPYLDWIKNEVNPEKREKR